MNLLPQLHSYLKENKFNFCIKVQNQLKDNTLIIKLNPFSSFNRETQTARFYSYGLIVKLRNDCAIDLNNSIQAVLALQRHKQRILSN